MKAHLRLVGNADDDYIAAMVLAATQFVQQYTGRLIYPQSINEYIDAFPAEREMPLHAYPVSTVDVSYFASIDDDVYTATTDYVINAFKRPVTVEAKSSWPTHARRQMAVLAAITGGDGEPLPEIVHAIKIIVGFWYEQPDEVGVSIPAPARALLLQHRIFR